MQTLDCRRIGRCCQYHFRAPFAHLHGRSQIHLSHLTNIHCGAPLPASPIRRFRPELPQLDRPSTIARRSSTALRTASQLRLTRSQMRLTYVSIASQMRLTSVSLFRLKTSITPPYPCRDQFADHEFHRPLRAVTGSAIDWCRAILILSIALYETSGINPNSINLLTPLSVIWISAQGL